MRNNYFYKFFQKIWRSTFKTVYFDTLLHLDYLQYEVRKQKIVKNVFSKNRINVVFFVVNLGMWKNDYLFEMLLNDKRFNPVVVSFPLPNDSTERQISVQQEIELYFKRKGYPFIKGFDFDNNTFFDPRDLQPDIVLYAQPYRNGYPLFDVKRFWHNSLFIYIPYCILMEKGERFSNTLIQNISWKIFLPTSDEKLLYKECLSKGRNCYVTGSPIADYICTNDSPMNHYWKGKGKKRIIWAPHHSILKTDTLNYSNFLEMADSMIEIAKKFEDDIYIVFKPHPMLKDKLYKLQDWGIKKTDDYYQLWATMPNTSICDGIYYDLFRSSDGLIHDCSSFSAEYLFTEKPVLYLTKEDHLEFLNDFGAQCFNLHYKGSTYEDICHFIEEVVIKGNDYLFNARVAFKNEKLLPYGQSSSVNMYNEIITAF